MVAPKNTKPLTTKTVEAMKPGCSDKADVGENRGLRVRCGSSGVKTFFYRYRSPVTDKLVQLKIGNFPEVSLLDARVQLVELKKQRDKGICPASSKKQAKKVSAHAVQEIQVQADFSVKNVVDLYLTEYIEDKILPSGKIKPGARKFEGQKETRRTLEADVIPALGKRAADSIVRKDVVGLVMSIVARGANVQAGNVLRELIAAYEYSIGLGKLPSEYPNPGVLAKASLNQAKVKLSSQRGKRFLTDAELTQFLNWLPGSAYTSVQKNILRFTLLTGCRTGEVCVAEWKDIDLDAGTFLIVESKTDTQRSVQLSRQAVELVRSLKFTTDRYLFPSQKTGLPLQQKQLTEQAWRLRKSGRMLDIDHWTPHDLRRTVRTGLSRLRCPSEVAEAAIGHARAGIEGTYDLHRYEPECKEWLQRWADHLDSLV